MKNLENDFTENQRIYRDYERNDSDIFVQMIYDV